MNEKIATRPQLLHLVGAMAQNMPADLLSDVAKDWNDDPEALQQFLAGLRDGPFSQVQRREFEVVIRQRTVEEWVAAGKYNYANPNYTNTNFGQFVTSGTGKAKVVAFNLGRPATIDKAKRIRQRLGLKPIGWEHLAAVGEQHPKAQQELGWIVDVDHVWERPDGRRDVSYLFGFADDRSLDLRDADGEWSAYTWFFGLSE